MNPDERAKLIREYERLRKLAHELDVQSNTIERRLVEIERLLPDRYSYPEDVFPSDADE